MKATKKIVGATCALVAAVALSAGSTFAWFASNNSVSVSGMSVSAKVSSNLLIADATNDTWKSNDSTFTTAVTQAVGASNKLAPVSSVNGKNFFYTAPTNVKGDGSVNSTEYIAMDSNFTNLNSAYGSDAGYFDYHFVLKAQNVTSGTQYVNLTTLTLTYSGATDGDLAYRVAVIAENLTSPIENGTKTAALDGSEEAMTILAPTGAVYYTANSAADSTSTVATIASLNTAASVATVNAGQTVYTEVIIRLWLEGEDKTCTIEQFKALTGAWNLSVAFTIEDTTTNAVKILTMATTPVGP